MNSEWQQQVAYMVAIADFGQFHIDDKVKERLTEFVKIDFAAISSRFHEAKNGKIYAHHFWFNALLAVPAYKFLTYFEFNPLRSFILTNILLLIALAYFLFFKLQQPDIYKRIFIISLFLINPMIRYMNWPVQAFSLYVLLSFAVLFFYQRAFSWAILFSVCAALQQPIIALFTLYICIIYFWELSLKQHVVGQKLLVTILKTFNKNYKDIIFNALLSLGVFIQPVFYKINFGVFNLLEEKKLYSLNHFELTKLYSIFFDLNQGIIVYFFSAFLISIYAFYQFFKNRNLQGILLFFVV